MALQAWQDFRQNSVVSLLLKHPDPDSEFPIIAALRSSDPRSVGGQIDAMQQKISQLNEEIFERQQNVQNLRLLASQIKTMLKTPELKKKLSSRDELRLRTKRRKTLLALRSAKTSLRSAAIQNRSLTDGLMAAQSFFAHDQIVEFCRSGRYSLNPLNLANALAGLPFIGYRQSTKRCRKWKESTGQRGYRIFRLIRRIFDECGWGRSSERKFLRWVEANKSKRNPAISELSKNSYFLRAAIKAASNHNEAPPNRIPYVITSQYFSHLENPSTAEKILEQRTTKVSKKILK